MLVLPFCSWFLFTVTFVLFLCDFPGAHPLPRDMPGRGATGLRRAALARAAGWEPRQDLCRHSLHRLNASMIKQTQGNYK